MHFFTHFLFVVFFAYARAQTHGEGAEGTEMGPVAFLWPSDRNWTASADNIAPCGSADGPSSNRTAFPLSQGAVALTIADEAWNIAIRLATGNDPRSQSDFLHDHLVSNISSVDPGHQCYKLHSIDGITAGTNATIQMEYWSEFEGENNGGNQSFFACADITFVKVEDFKITAPCFNVTSDDFEAPSASGSSTAVPTSSSSSGASSSEPTASASGGSGLSTGAKAGIAVGSVIGGLALLGFIGFLMWRRGKEMGLKGKEEYELRAKNLGSPEPGAQARS